jgi:hypothetical protein
VYDLDSSVTDTQVLAPDATATCELLCFIQNKMQVLAFDDIVTLVSDYYTTGEVESARKLLTKFTSSRLPKPKGSAKEKNRRIVADMLKLCLDPAEQLPAFRAVDLSRLPPVGVDHVDLSAMLQELASLRAEVRAAVNIRAELAEIRGLLNAGRPVADAEPTQAAVTRQPPSPEIVELQNVDSGTRAAAEPQQQSIPPVSVPDPTASSDAVSSGPRQTVPVNDGVQHRRSAAQVLTSAIQSGSLRTQEKRKPKPPTIGTRQAGLTGQLKAVRTRRRLDLFISRLSSDASATELETYTGDILSGCCHATTNLFQVTCINLPTKFASYASFHVTVHVPDELLLAAQKSLLSADSWPAGVLVRRYFTPKHNGAKP